MRKQLVIGMPGSGKSTYLGALRHLVVDGEVDLALRFERFSGDEQHLNALEQKWLACEEMDRTGRANEAWVEMILSDRETGDENALAIPDLRGELFVRPATRSRFPRDLYEAVRDADGFLLFTNADRPDDTIRIDDLVDIMDNEEEERVELSTFRPEEMPEEAMIVEFLQMANRRPLFARHRKLAVIVSAWDVVPDGTAPLEWLASHRPMLAQYLQHNEELWDVRVFGVSAQGGKLPADAKALQAIDVPSHRVRVVGHGAAKHDLSAPFRWLVAKNR